MSVSDGELGNAANFNSSFVSKQDDSTMDGVLSLEDGASGGIIANAQQSINTNAVNISSNDSDITDLQNDKATTELDNLGTTAINADLTPDTTDTYDLGSLAALWANMNTDQLSYQNSFIRESGVVQATLKGNSGNVELSQSGTTKLLITMDEVQTESEFVMKQQATPSNPAATYNKIYSKSDDKWYTLSSAGVETELGSGGAGGSAIEVNQATHGFTILDGIYHNGTIWVKAQANASTTLPMYCVSEVVDTNNFVATKFGSVTATAHGKTVGEFYFQDTSVAGTPTSTTPTTGFNAPLFYVEDANTVHMLVHRAVDAGGVVTQDQIVYDNLIINGDCRIEQRGLLPVTGVVEGAYYSDRWRTSRDTVTGDASTTTASQPTGMSGSSSLKYTATSTASGRLGAFQIIENFDLVKGRPIVFSVWVKSNSSDARIHLWDGVSVFGNPVVLAHSGGGGWEKLVMTGTPSASATVMYATIRIQSALTASVSITSGDYIEFTGAKYEFGDIATDFRPRSTGEELALCQRYFYSVNSDDPAGAFDPICMGKARSSTTGDFHLPLPTTMRTNGTVSYTTPTALKMMAATTSDIAVTSVVSTVTTNKLVRMELTSAGTLVAGNATLLRATTAFRIDIDAEL